MWCLGSRSSLRARGDGSNTNTDNTIAANNSNNSNNSNANDDINSNNNNHNKSSNDNSWGARGGTGPDASARPPRAARATNGQLPDGVRTSCCSMSANIRREKRAVLVHEPCAPLPMPPAHLDVPCEPLPPPPRVSAAGLCLGSVSPQVALLMLSVACAYAAAFDLMFVLFGQSAS